MATVLIVDDDELLRRTYARVLMSWGHQAITYPDAGQALVLADFDAIDLIITDLNMPTPGEVLIEYVKTQGFTTPIIALSGFLDDHRVKRLTAMGVTMILHKPVDIAELSAAVTTALSNC